MLALANKLTTSTQPIYRFVNKYSIDFDGVDDCIVTDGADTVAQPTTYSFWCKSSETGTNKGVFGHGGTYKGAFHFNYVSDRPLLYIGGSYYVFWVDTPAQDDGEWHHWVVYVDYDNISNSKLYVDSVLQTTHLVVQGAAEPFTESLTIGSDRQVGGHSFEGKIDEFAVYDRELTQAEITRMYNTYYSPNRVANSNFSQIGNEEVTNGDFSQIGSELVTNGDFATDSDWIKQTGWTISSGSANYDDAVSTSNVYISNSISLLSAKQYKLTFEVNNTSSTGQILFQASGGGVDNLNSYTEYTTGIHTIYFNVTANRSSLKIFGRDGYGNFSIDNVSVKEVGQDYNFGTGWTMGDGKAVSLGSNEDAYLSQNNTFVAGKIYKVTFDVNDYTSGTLSVRAINEASALAVTSTGSYVVYITPISNISIGFRSAGTGGYVGSVDNISVKEVGQHWTFGTGWSTDGTKAIAGSSSDGNFLYSAQALVIGKTYKVSFSAIVSSGTVRVYSGGFPGLEVSSTSSFTGSFVAAATQFGFYSSGFDGSIDNIVVQELKHDATNLMLNAGAYQSANPLITSTKSMEFDGSDDYLQLSEPFSYTNHTICGWAYSGVTNANNMIFSASDSSSDGIRLVYRSSSNFRYEVNGQNIDTAADTREANRWYFVCGTYDGTTARLYIDGVELANATTSETISTTTNARIGSVSYAESTFFDGKITEVGAYNRALTSLEVASLYNQGMPTNLLVNRNNYQSGNPTVFNTKQVDFDGTDDYLDTNKSDFLGTSDFTISGWIKPEDITDNYLLGQSEDTNNRWYVRITSSSYLQFYSKSGGVEQVLVASSITISNNEWVHFVITADRGANTIVYVNGIANNTSTNANTSTLTNTGNFRIGSFELFAGYWNGQISQVGIWNEVLTADEVSSLYNHGLPIDLTTDQAAYESSSNLVGYWRMGSGTLDTFPVIYDQTNTTTEAITVKTPSTQTYSLNNVTRVNDDSANSVSFTTTTATSGAFALGYMSSAGLLNSNLAVGVYKLSFTLSTNSTVFGNNMSMKWYNTGSTFTETAVTLGQNTIYGIITSASNNSHISLSGNAIGQNIIISNITLDKLNGNPAIMTNQTSSDIENGSPYANLIQNNDFSLGEAGYWNVGTHWDIANGVATCDGLQSSANNLYQVPYIVGKTYKTQLTVNAINGTLKVFTGTGSASLTITSAGTYDVTKEADSSTVLYIQAQASSSMTIDNVTVEEVNTGLQGYWKMGDGTNDEYPVIYDQTNPTLGSEVVTNGDFATNTDWTLLGDWEISGGSLNIVGGINNATQGGVFETGKFYKFEFDIVVTSGYCRVYFGSSGTTIKQQISTSGHYIIYGIAESPTLTFRSATTTDLSIDNVSVKEVQGNPATMTNMVEGNITNQYPLTKIRNYYRMGDGILDGYPIIQDQTSPNLAHIPTTNLIEHSERFTNGYDWTVQSGLTVTDNFATAPNGTQTASKVIGNGSVGLYQIKSITGNVARSVYLKSITGNVNVILKDPALTVTQKTCNLTTEWQRFELSEDNGHGSQSGIWIDDIPASGIYIWGAQLEEQSQATAYLKSDGIAAVRKATTTNLVDYSEDFSQSSWANSNISASISTVLSPDGTSYSYKLTNNAVSGNHFLRDTITVTNGLPYTLSVFIKKGTRDIVSISDGFNVNVLASFDLTNGTVTNASATSSSIESHNNDWFKCIATMTPSSTTLGFMIMSGTVYAGTDESGDFYVWAAQVEQQTQAETYAKTTGLPVTIDLFTENNYGTMTNMSASDIIEDTPNN